MGFKKKTHTKGTFVKVARGHLCVPCDEDDEGAVEHEYKGVVSHELQYDAFEGHIEKAFIKESSSSLYPDQLILTVRDRSSKNTINIAMAYDSSYAMKFYKNMKNLDLTQPVEFAPYCFTPKGEAKEKSGWNLNQGDVKVEDFWTKDEIPEWVETWQTVKGKKEKKKVYDYTDAMNFFIRHFTKWQTKNNLMPEQVESEDDEAPRKKKAPVEDDDDEPTPRKKKAPVEDDDDDEPTPRKKKRPVEDDDDDEPAPPKKKKPPVEDDDDEDEPVVKMKKALVDDDDDEDEKPVVKKKKPPVVEDDDDDEEVPVRKKR